APAAATNTLLLGNAGTVTPLEITDVFTVGPAGAIVITNSSLLLDQLDFEDANVDGSLELQSGSKWTSDPDSILNFGTLTNSTFTVKGGQMNAGYLYVNDKGCTITVSGGTTSFAGGVGAWTAN